MKILMLGWELPPHNSGGLGVACYQMCKHLALSGVSIEFVLPYLAPQEVHKTAHFMKVHSALPVVPEALANVGGVYDSHCYGCEAVGCAHVMPHDLRSQQQHFTHFVDKLCQNNTYDAIHAHEWLTFEAGIRAKQRTGKPFIAHVHATEFDRSGEFGGNPIVHDIEYNGLMMADRIVAVSNITKNLIVREYNIPASKIQVAHNGIDHDDLTPLDDENAYRYLTQMKQRGYKVVVSLGRLTTQKGLRYLLNAAQLVVHQNPKVLFVLAGDGELRNQLLMQSAELGIAKNIIFTGFVRGKQWRDSYGIGDIFVMSSVSEPFGLSALEAAAYHNAVLLTEQSGVGEIIHSVIRYDYWDTHKLADAILNIAQTPVLQNVLATNVQNECRQLSWHKAAQTCRKVYNELAGVTV